MRYIGVMSGTSCDGIDVALLNFENGIDTEGTHFLPYPQSVRNLLQDVIKQQPLTIAQFSELDAQLGRLYAQAINQLLVEQNLSKNDIRAIGLHGQTVFHDPVGENANTLQLGSAAMVAQQTGIVTVANFRQMDLAYGGQGAPLAPAFHQYVFKNLNEPLVVLNLGGIANITYIADDEVMGFDTGPANCLMDDWIQFHHSTAFDANGAWAQQGEVNQALLNMLLQEPYFELIYPKSTGRELFNLDWLKKHQHVNDLSPVDVQRTLLQLTVESIAKGLEQIKSASFKVIVCGGGSHNKFLLEQLSNRLNKEVLLSADYGVDPDFMEANLMAWMAKQNIENVALDLSAITGATAAFIYGVKHLP